MSENTILVTGGAGYIGSHTVVELLQTGFNVVIVDNLDNSDACVIDRIEAIAGRRPKLVVADIRDRATVAAVLKESNASAVIHFAGLKVVSESCAEPLRYYDVNVVGTLRLLEAMTEAGVSRMVFSSSTTVYGDTAAVPITENAPLNPACPYGRSKLMVEDILRDLACVSGTDWRFVILRYFNPVGAHESGLIGEDPNGTPTNLMPYVTQVAVGRLAKLSIFGDDYPTPDGTAIRDFIHVVDLAKGHLAALQALKQGDKVVTVNLGTGRGSSVLELVTTFAEVSGVGVPYEFAARRQGDVAISYADASRARMALGWKAERDLAAMCRDAWNWQSRNPGGYRAKEGTAAVERARDSQGLNQTAATNAR
jgi:UDP-glucose 4-epimerase